MSLKEQQSLIARLYVDDSFRTLFFNDPKEISKDYLLSEKELASLISLNKSAVDYFATTLKAKRIRQFVRAYPLLFGLNHQEINRFARRYCALYVLHPSTLHHNDILDFGDFIEKTVDGCARLPPYSSDLARFEKLVYDLSHLERTWQKSALTSDNSIQCVDLLSKPVVSSKVKMVSFHFDILKLVKFLSPNSTPAETEFERGAFYVLAGIDQFTGGTILLQINETVRKLLIYCDHKNTVETIIEKFTSSEKKYEIESSIIESLQRLATVGVILPNKKDDND